MWSKIKCLFGFHDYKITETYIFIGKKKMKKLIEFIGLIIGLWYPEKDIDEE